MVSPLGTGAVQEIRTLALANAVVTPVGAAGIPAHRI